MRVEGAGLSAHLAHNRHGLEEEVVAVHEPVERRAQRDRVHEVGRDHLPHGGRDRSASLLMVVVGF